MNLEICGRIKKKTFDKLFCSHHRDQDDMEFSRSRTALVVIIVLISIFLNVCLTIYCTLFYCIKVTIQIIVYPQLKQMKYSIIHLISKLSTFLKMIIGYELYNNFVDVFTNPMYYASLLITCDYQVYNTCVL